MEPREALHQLLAQHEELRSMMDRCEALADALDAGGGDPVGVTQEIHRLREAFEAHNHFEEQYLRPILRGVDAFGDVRFDQMLADHAGEHRMMEDRLETGITGELRRTIARLRNHLTTEERYFLSSKVLREDLVVIEGTG